METLKAQPCKTALNGGFVHQRTTAPCPKTERAMRRGLTLSPRPECSGVITADCSPELLGSSDPLASASQVAGITGVSPHIHLRLRALLETISAHCNLHFPGSSNSSTSASRVAGITEMGFHHVGQAGREFATSGSHSKQGAQILIHRTLKPMLITRKPSLTTKPQNPSSSKPCSPADGNGGHQLLGPSGRDQQDGFGSRVSPLLLLAGPQKLHGRVEVAGQAGLGGGGGHRRGVRAGLPHLGGDPTRRVCGEAVQGIHDHGRASHRGVPSRGAVVLGCHVR
ncbi:hypothetical protein AAY473_034944 [Plecturocebus cupreus]